MTWRRWSIVVLSPQEPVCWMAIPPKIDGFIGAERSTTWGSRLSEGWGVVVST